MQPDWLSVGETTDTRHAALSPAVLAFETLEQVQRARTFHMQAITLCNELAGRLRAEHVALGVMHGKQVHLAAMDHTDHFSRKFERARLLEAAMEECLDQGVPILYPAPEESASINRMTMELAQESGAHQVIVAPLFYQQQPVMALSLEFGSADPFNLNGLSSLWILTRLAAPRLYESFLRDAWFGLRLARSIHSQAIKLIGPEHTWLKLITASFACILIGSICVQGTYKVEAPIVVQSVHRRIVTSPFDGFIESVNVLPGDKVIANKNILAQLDNNEIKLQIAEAEAEKYSWGKQVDQARQEGKTAEAQVAEGKERQQKARLALLQDKLKRSEILAAIDGFIRSRDLHLQVGKKVTAGEQLLEIEGLDSLQAVLRVPEADILDLKINQQGEVRITAQPGQQIPVHVDRIVSSASVVDGQNIFEVWASFAEPPPWLRPAMEGEGKIEIGRRSYFFIWTKRFINWLRMQLWI